MIFTVLQESIKRALAVVLPAVAAKSTLSVLHNVLLTADDNGLMLAGTNLETSITTRVGAKVETPGATTIPAKLLSDLIGGLPNVPVSFELNERTQTTTIHAEKFNTSIKGIEADEYPTLVTSAADPLFSMPGADWAIVADQVAMAASTEDGWPVLKGVHIFSKDGLTFEAADSYRLARKRFDLEPTAHVDTIIPAPSLAMARSVFGRDEEVSFSIANTGGLAVFRSDSATLTSRVIDGKYPDLDRMVPTNYTSRLIVLASDLAARVKLAKYVAVASANIVRLDLTVLEDMNGRLAIGANAAEVADLKDAIDVLATGKDVTIALNVKLLSDAIAACSSGGEIAIELQDASRPAVLRAVGDDSMLQLVMPMTVR